MDDKNLFSDVNAGKNQVVNKIKQTTKNYLPYILLAVNIVFRIILRLYDTSVVNPFTKEFFLDATTSVISTMFCYIVFIPFGEKNEELNSPSYKDNCTMWGKLSDKIRSGGLLEAFRKYCREQLEIEREEIRAVTISNNTTFSFEEYKERFSELGNKELKSLYLNGEITKEEYKVILKCNGKIKVKPINSVLILSGVAKATYNDAGRDESRFVLMWLAKKPVVIVAMCIALNAISATFIGLSGFSVIYEMVIDTLFVILASFVGYGAGEQAIRDRENKIKNRILFIESFLEKVQSGVILRESRNICINTKEDC